MIDNKETAGISDPVVYSPRGGGVSLIWLVPIFALLLGAGVAWHYYSNLGPVITISFEAAEGVTPNATKVRYKHVDIGDVIAVGLEPGSDGVVVSARIDRAAQHLLGSETRFWIVKPRAGIGGISGIGTILSGTYIDTDPGGAAGTSAFTGLEEPPLTPFSKPGLRIILKAKQARSIRVGSPVYFREIKVGQVDARKFTDNYSAVEFDLFIQQVYADLLSTNSRFWNASGLDVSITADGAEIRTPSLESLLEGGISFDTPPQFVDGEPVANGAEYLLYDDRASAFENGSSEKVTFLLHFDGSVRGLDAGAPVEFLGIPVGDVISVDLFYDAKSSDVSVPVLIEIDPFLLFGEQLDAKEVHHRFSKLVQMGLKAQLKNANFVTGQLLVELAIRPDEKVVRLENGGDYRVLPTVPNTITQISQGLEGLMTKFNALEIEPVLAEVQTLAAELRKFTSLPALKTLPKRIDEVAGAVQVLVEGKASDMAGSLGPDGELHDQLVAALKELQKMSDSLRQLSDTLVEKPNALLFGKSKKSANKKKPAPRSAYDRQ